MRYSWAGAATSLIAVLAVMTAPVALAASATNISLQRQLNALVTSPG